MNLVKEIEEEMIISGLKREYKGLSRVKKESVIERYFVKFILLLKVSKFRENTGMMQRESGGRKEEKRF